MNSQTENLIKGQVDKNEHYILDREARDGDDLIPCEDTEEYGEPQTLLLLLLVLLLLMMMMNT